MILFHVIWKSLIQPEITFSKLTIESQEEDVKYVQS